MPVPKQRLSPARQGSRRSNWKATLPTLGTCPNCGAPKHPHTLCGTCGYYKGALTSQRFNKLGSDQ